MPWHERTEHLALGAEGQTIKCYCLKISENKIVNPNFANLQLEDLSNLVGKSGHTVGSEDRSFSLSETQ